MMRCEKCATPGCSLDLARPTAEDVALIRVEVE
jgi:hypothetical protein